MTKVHNLNAMNQSERGKGVGNVHDSLFKHNCDVNLLFELPNIQVSVMLAP
jgi:hypothetical protein